MSRGIEPTLRRIAQTPRNLCSSDGQTLCRYYTMPLLFRTDTMPLLHNAATLSDRHYAATTQCRYSFGQAQCRYSFGQAQCRCYFLTRSTHLGSLEVMHQPAGFRLMARRAQCPADMHLYAVDAKQRSHSVDNLSISCKTRTWLEPNKAVAAETGKRMKHMQTVMICNAWPRYIT
jgi:hypothetical protein